MTAVCPWDGVAFTPKSSRNVYCSKACCKRVFRARRKYGDAWQEFVNEAKCPCCGAVFRKSRLDRVYCSKKCSAKARRRSPPPVRIVSSCGKCGLVFIARSVTNTYCSNKCRRRSEYLKRYAKKESLDPACSECGAICERHLAGTYLNVCSAACRLARKIRLRQGWKKKNKGALREYQRQRYAIARYALKHDLSDSAKMELIDRFSIARKIVGLRILAVDRAFWIDLAEIVHHTEPPWLVTLDIFAEALALKLNKSSAERRFLRWRHKMEKLGLGADNTSKDSIVGITIDIQLCSDCSNVALGIPII